MEAFQTLRAFGADELLEKKSRFIGYAAPASSEEEARDFLQQLRKKHWDASHNVSAYVLRGGLQHSSDDGEPQGTAGAPVLNVLLKSGVTDAVVVVTRYFGGTLLGAGGLVRAYSRAASLGLAAAGIVHMRPCGLFTLACPYPLYGKVAALLPEHGAVVDGTDFQEDVTLSFHLEETRRVAFETALTDATSGAVSVRKNGESYFSE